MPGKKLPFDMNKDSLSVVIREKAQSIDTDAGRCGDLVRGQ